MRLFESYMITFALMNSCERRTTDVFTILFLGVAYFLLGRIKKAELQKDRVLSGVCSVIFTTCYVLGNLETLSGGLTNKFFLLFYLGCTVIGLLFLFYRIVTVFLVNSAKIRLFEEAKSFSIKSFFLISGVVFLCILPFFLTNFPAVMTPDSLSQYRQVVGLEKYNDHHPWMHTLVINLFYEIGYSLTGNTYMAIACYTVAQMVLVAISIGYVWTTLYEMGLKKKFCICGVVLFVIYPYNLIYGVTIWKDVLFSMSVLVLTLTIFRMHVQYKLAGKIEYRDWILYFACGFFMCMFRHNGFYAFAVAGMVLVCLFKKKWKKMLFFTLIIIGLCLVITGPVMKAADVISGQFAYKICIPLQQVGRVIADGCELTEEEIETIEKINIISYVEDNYQKHGADPMFAWVTYGNQEYLKDNIGEYCDLWISLGLRYPDKYIQAFIDVTKGYWYPMDPGQVINLGITENENGLVSQPILNGPVVVKVHELLTKLYTIFPIYGIMYSMGAAFWFFILLMATAIRNCNHSMWIAGIPLLLLTFTLFIAVPLVADVRYGYPLLLAIPSVAVFTFFNNRENTNEKLYERI